MVYEPKYPDDEESYDDPIDWTYCNYCGAALSKYVFTDEGNMEYDRRTGQIAKRRLTLRCPNYSTYKTLHIYVQAWYDAYRVETFMRLNEGTNSM